MITVVIQGGLGNQLFQYAYGRALERLGKNVQFNTRFFNGLHTYTPRAFSLTKFNLPETISFTNENYSQSFLQRALCVLDRDRRVRFIPFSQNADTYIADGYYNSEKYFTTIRELLLKELVLKDSEKSDTYRTFEQKILTAKKPLIVHARRGDYLTSSAFEYLGKEYYERALAQFDTDCDIFGFSDDPIWLDETISRSVTMVSGNGLTDYEELSLMSLGQNFIIANSTFSWWGAWLAQYKDKKVVAPKRWFKSVLWWRANRDVIPEGWVRV